MDREAITKARADVVEKFINIEVIINAIISQHYFRRVLMPFILEVLYDENFSFGLKRNILEKVVPNLDRDQLQALNRLNRIRNYFAHCGLEIFEGSGVPRDEHQVRIPDPRELDKSLDFESLYSEFLEKEPNVVRYLFEVSQKLGVIAVKGQEGG